ncbi:MAG: acetate--CoA ligase family protein, partial [Planctomycetes bacterium]|nr:acetate--CoA ligase family protein [Planctomycetota bacterium]
ELFDVARAFANQPIPRGRRVGIVTNAGGPGILAADALVARGLELPETRPELRAELAAILPEEATLTNPVDLIGSATTGHYRAAIEALAKTGDYDALIVICVPTVMHDPTDVYLAAADAAEQAGLPCLGVFMGADDVRERARERTGRERFPAYHFPESAVGALGMMVEYAERRSRVPGKVIEFEDDSDLAKRLIADVRASGRTELDLDESRRLLACYGVPFARSGVARDADAAAQLAGEIAGPVVLKAMGAGLSHKSDLGGVLVGLDGEEGVREGYRELEDRMASVPNARLEGVLVQEMVTDAREVIIGMSHDPAFGPLLMFGLGGIYVEVLKDVAFRVLPFTDRDAHEMVRSVRALPILEGVRGNAPVCFEKLEEVLLRVAQLVRDFPEIAELDINPLMASPDPTRCLAVDARVRLSAL